MLITNQTNSDYWFGPLHLPAGVNQQITVDDTSATSLYLTSDAVADAINNLATAGKITVTNEAQPFPRPTGVPSLLHGDGVPEGLVYAPQGSMYARRDGKQENGGVLYLKTSGVTSNTGWLDLATASGATAVLPAGLVMAFGGPAAPTGWVFCDGSALSRTTYSLLFAAIGTTYGAGDGTTTFNLPDLRGRLPVGLGTNGTVNALGLNDGVAVANRRGTKHRHTPHAHPAATGVFIVGIAQTVQATGSDQGGTTSNPNTGSADGGSGVSTDPLDGGAYLVLNYIIKT